jgi:diguanylate cyclase
VLRTFAQILRKQTPPTATVGRWGGEEFLLVLPDIPLDRAVDLVERLREAALEIRLPGTPDLRVRFSAGLASRGTWNLVLDEIIANADAALYEAKKEGRDLTCVDGDSYPAPSAHVRRTSRSSQPPDPHPRP